MQASRIVRKQQNQKNTRGRGMYLKMESKLLSVLPTGKTNAQTASAFANRLMWNKRIVTKEMCRLRRIGIPVCGYSTGYALADSSTDELDCYIRQFSRRISEMKKTLAALEEYRDKEKTAIAEAAES